MRTFLVAMVATDEDTLTRALVGAQLTDEASVGGYVDCWWIAEDDRHDRSDNDSAIFVPRGAQEDFTEVLRQHIEAHRDEWDEEGYPYPDDVTGVWYLPPTQRQWQWLPLPKEAVTWVTTPAPTKPDSD